MKIQMTHYTEDFFWGEGGREEITIFTIHINLPFHLMLGFQNQFQVNIPKVQIKHLNLSYISLPSEEIL